MAERVKIEIGSAFPFAEEKNRPVRGRDLVSGLPKTFTLSSYEIRDALSDPLQSIITTIRSTLEETPPELSADILDRGIIMTGGGSKLKGMDQIIRERTNVPVNVAEDPLLSVVRGTGMVLENLKKYEAVLL